MNRRKAIATLSVASATAAQTGNFGVRDRFVGVWKLVSSESREKASGKVSNPYGKNPIGRLTYDAAGRMSAQLMNRERRAVGGPPTRGTAVAIREASTEDMRAILTGFSAYFGTFDVDEAAGTVIHHVQGAVIPSWIGSDQRRQYEFAGSNRLVLTAAFDQSVSRLVWEREP